MVEAIILAAGKSSRMGGDNKMLLPYDDSTILNKVIKEVAYSKVSHITVVLGHDYEKVKKSVLSDEVEYVYNQKWETGQTGSIIAGMARRHFNSEGVMIVLGDMPMITSFHYDELINEFLKNNKPGNPLIMRPVYKDFSGHPIFFDKYFFDDIINCDTPDGCKSVIEKNKESFKPIDVTELRYFFDVDTPNDYRRLMNTLDLKAS